MVTGSEFQAFLTRSLKKIYKKFALVWQSVRDCLFNSKAEMF